MWSSKMKVNMSAPFWLCLILLTASSCHGRPNWPSGELENKGVELRQQRPVQRILEAQDAVKSLVEGARKESLERLAAMKQKHADLLRLNFYNAMEKRLFRLNTLKPQASWQQNPCRGSILSCFNIPKFYLSRPLHSKVSYISHPNICNTLPSNTYIFQECIRRAILPTVKSTSEIYPALTTDSSRKIIDDQAHYTTEELSTDKTQVSLPEKNISDSSSTELNPLTSPKSIENVQKLDTQKTSIQLENEILRFGDLEQSHTSKKTNPTTTQISVISEEEAINIESTPKVDLTDARNDPDSLILPVERCTPTAISAMSNSVVNTSTNKDFKSQTVSYQPVTLSPPISSNIPSEAKENVYTEDVQADKDYITSSYPTPKTLISTTHFPYDYVITESITKSVVLNKTQTNAEPYENVEELNNEVREGVFKEYVSTSSNPVVQNGFDINTEMTTSEVFGREEPQDAISSPQESSTLRSSTGVLFVKTSENVEHSLPEMSSTSATTILSKHSEENNGKESLIYIPNKNNDISQQPPIFETTRLYITNEEPIAQTISEIESQQPKEIVIPQPVLMEPTTTTGYVDLDIAFRTDEIEPYIGDTNTNDHVHFPRENITFNSNVDTIKESDVGIVETTHYGREDVSTTQGQGHKQQLLNAQDKLLEQTLSYYSQTGGLNWDFTTTSVHNALEHAREFTTHSSIIGLNENSDNIARQMDGLKLAENVDNTDSIIDIEETTLDSTTIDDAYKKSKIEIVDTTEHSKDSNADLTSKYGITDQPYHLTDNISSKSSITPFTAKSDDNSLVSSSSTTQNIPNEILKFTNEIESTRSYIISTNETSSTPADLNLNDQPYMLEHEKGLFLQRKKRSEDNETAEFEDSLISKANTSDVYVFISPAQYASMILELLPVILEGYKNNAFSDEDKKAISLIYGDVKPRLNEESVMNITEPATDLLMDEETTLRTDGEENNSDYDSFGGYEDITAKDERRLKRSKNLQLLNSIVENLSKHLQTETSLPLPIVRQSRKIRSSGSEEVSEAATILALLAENSEGVQLDRADDYDDDDYEYYEDDEGSRDIYEDEYDENPSFSELIKLANKHREQKAKERE